MSDPETTKTNQGGISRWKPGQSGNPKGRPKGSRHKLAAAFVDDMYADWLEAGALTIQQVRLTRPDVYLKVVASIIPKELVINDEASMVIRAPALSLSTDEWRSTFTPNQPEMRTIPGAPVHDQMNGLKKNGNGHE